MDLWRRSLHLPKRASEPGKHGAPQQAADMPPVVYDCNRGPDQQVDHNDEDRVPHGLPSKVTEQFAILIKENILRGDQPEDCRGGAYREAAFAREEKGSRVPGKSRQEIHQREAAMPKMFLEQRTE